MKKIVLCAMAQALILLISATSLIAEEAQVNQDISLRWNYLIGKSSYLLPETGSKPDVYVKDGYVFELLFGKTYTPHFNVALSPAVLHIQNDMQFWEFVDHGYPYGVGRKWIISTKIDSFLLALRPTLKLSIADIINIGFETGLGIAYSMKKEVWKSAIYYSPQVFERGDETIYAFDPFFDIGAEISWIINKSNELGINFNYYPITSEFAHYTGGKYYRGGLFFKMNY